MLISFFSKFLCYPQTGSTTLAIIPDNASTTREEKQRYVTGERTPPLAAFKENPAEQKKSCFLSEEDLVCSKQT